MQTWTGPVAPTKPLTDDQIIAACLVMLKRYRPLPVSWSSRIVAGRLTRLATRCGAR